MKYYILSSKTKVKGLIFAKQRKENSNPHIFSGPAKWISKWRWNGTLKSIVGHHRSPTRKNLNFKRSGTAKQKGFDLGNILTVTYWLLLFFLCFSFLFLLGKKVGAVMAFTAPSPLGVAGHVFQKNETVDINQSFFS